MLPEEKTNQEKRLHELRAKAWEAFRQGLVSGADAPQLFARASEVYERELSDRIDADQASDRDYADDVRSLTRARTNVQQMIDSQKFGAAEHYGLQMVLADLNAVLGPDLLREADPTGKVLKALPFEERKRMLDAIDSGTKAIEVLEPVNLRPLSRDEVAERLSDYLTQLGIDPDETFEGDVRTTAQILVDVALATDGSVAVQVGSPEHQVAERVHVAEMSTQDVARGER